MAENLIKNLLQAKAFPHATSALKLLETHISWIILTGEFAYKIKKPVDFGFLNYSTLEKRKFYCEEELRANQLLAPEIYLEVVTINGSVDEPNIQGNGAIIEYAVKMREFNQENLFSAILKRKQLTPELIEQMATMIAEFHQKTPIAPADSILGTPEHVHAPVKQNFDQIIPLLTDSKDKQQLDKLQTWSEDQFRKHHALFKQRKEQGYIRDCHGDLHLGNIILFNGKPVLFDRIEFNEDFRWTDVIADIAFLAMDLAEHKENLLAKRLLNTYFNATGDYQGLALLPYYQAYRAIVRAKISLFHAQQTNLSSQERQALQEKYRNFMNLAETYTMLDKPILFITHGLTGSGKSVLAKALTDNMSAYQVRSDVVRKNLLGLVAQAKTNSGINQGAYDPKITDQTYAALQSVTKEIITAGYSAVVDAAFLKSTQREKFYQLALELKVPFIILNCQASRPQLETWIAKRQQENQDPSEAGVEVLSMQEQTKDALDAREQASTILIDTTQINTAKILQEIKAKLK